ncbi:MAG TPA: efflux RND transporter periplasmic adaptor subunit [Aggregatilineales bacterium]|nr:efflux RND transporter periplasmic adaptor subunit [Aggregatilineales bacterium]
MESKPKPNRRRLIPGLVVVVLAVAGVVYYTQQASANNQPLTLSGTIEATDIFLASQSGGRVMKVRVTEGAQVQAGQTLVELYSETTHMNETITAPIDGTIMESLMEPGELAAPGSTLLVMANLNDLTLKVYAPEDRYGHIFLGQSYPVKVDSFPTVAYSGRVSFISDTAEFTPRNVQTIDGRKTTVYAIRLSLVSDGSLKPGMPADVFFGTP